MKYILLCAGYATRMYPLIENFPKPLLDIKGKALIDYLIEDLENNNLIDEYIIVSNHKFINHFNEWKNNNKYKNKISLLDDGTTNNDNRLGAIKDIWFAQRKGYLVRLCKMRRRFRIKDLCIRQACDTLRRVFMGVRSKRLIAGQILTGFRILRECHARHIIQQSAEPILQLGKLFGLLQFPLVLLLLVIGDKCMKQAGTQHIGAGVQRKVREP